MKTITSRLQTMLFFSSHLFVSFVLYSVILYKYRPHAGWCYTIEYFRRFLCTRAHAHTRKHTPKKKREKKEQKLYIMVTSHRMRIVRCCIEGIFSLFSSIQNQRTEFKRERDKYSGDKNELNRTGQVPLDGICISADWMNYSYLLLRFCFFSFLLLLSNGLTTTIYSIFSRIELCCWKKKKKQRKKSRETIWMCKMVVWEWRSQIKTENKIRRTTSYRTPSRMQPYHSIVGHVEVSVGKFIYGNELQQSQCSVQYNSCVKLTRYEFHYSQPFHWVNSISFEGKLSLSKWIQISLSLQFNHRTSNGLSAASSIEPLAPFMTIMAWNSFFQTYHLVGNFFTRFTRCKTIRSITISN